MRRAGQRSRVKTTLWVSSYEERKSQTTLGVSSYKEWKSLIIAISLHEKGRTALKSEDYALGKFL